MPSPPSLYAYRPDHSCDDIINIRQAILEDAIENTNTILIIGSDDKEKYFDRITLEYQCGAMLVAGCPAEGYVEMTAEDLTGHKVHILTDMGTVDAVFL